MGPGPKSIFGKLIASTLLLGAVFVYAVLAIKPAPVAAAVNEQINFQGRLLNSQGAVVPDGYYNIQFKVYQGGDGQSAGNPSGTLEWTEDYLNVNSQGVRVVNGFLSVQLGSVNPFGSSIDWDQDTLWLSMNIAGTNASCTPFASCTPDGEMVPMKRLSANAYALNAGRLGGLTAAGFLQNTTTPQTADFNITGNGTLGGNLNVAGNLNVTGNANLIKPATDSTTAFQIQPAGSTTPVFNVDTTNSYVGIGTAEAEAALEVASTLFNNDGGYNFNILSYDKDAVDEGVGGGIGFAGNADTKRVFSAIQGFHESTTAADYAGALRFLTRPSGSSTLNEQMRISADGQVGLGTTDPGYRLDVSGDINTSTAYRVGGVAGTSIACSGGQFLQDATTVGGIITGGSCTAATNGVDTVGVIDSQTKSANGAVIVGTTLYMQTADDNDIGLVSAGAQIFAGTKTFNGGLAIASGQAVNGSGSLTLQTDGTTRATFDTSNNLYLGNGATSATPNNFSVRGTSSSTSGTAGGTLTLQGGDATVGNANGGSLMLTGGAGIGTGASGLVVISTPTFSTTANDPNCFTGGATVAASCTIAVASVNNSAAIVVGFSTSGQTATLPDPTIGTAGRIVYITAANGSKDFTLSANSGGVGNTVAMRQNTSATMIWNGSDWTAAGASSSTTLQSAYDNTLQSVGGAELVVSKTSSTNGLTIRDSLTNPVDGTLFSVQTSSAANLLSVNSNVTEYASNAGAETAGATTSAFPANTWTAIGSTVSRYTTAGENIANGQASVSVATPATANTGVKNTLNTALTANTHYNVSFAARLTSGTFTDMNVYYSIDGSTASVACTTSHAVNSSVQTKVNCAFTAPSAGITSSNAILIRQTTGVARTFYIDNLSVTIAADYNYATDGSVDDGTNFATNWPAVSSTVTRSTTVGNDASNSVQVVTTAGSGQGVRNKLSVNPLQSTTYRVTVYTSSASSGFDSFTIRYSRDNGTSFVNCADYNTQEVSTPPNNFTKITCYITTDSTAATSPYVYFTQGDAVARTFYIDTFSMTLSTKITPNVQIGGGVNGGPVTLLTMDRAAAAPIASNNEALLGSMYYDTSLGKLQCYEADGWGACGSSPDDIVTISPEYTNAVLHGSGVGTMTSDICSDTLNINDGSSGQATICGTNETYNFYKWTSPQATAQTYSIFVTYQLPTTFKSFLSGQASLMGRTDSSNSTVQYQIYRQDTGSGLVPCGSAVSVSTGAVSSWQTGLASGAADPSTCGFTPGSSIVFKIDVIASQNANAYVGNLNFAFNNN